MNVTHTLSLSDVADPFSTRIQESLNCTESSSRSAVLSAHHPTVHMLHALRPHGKALGHLEKICMARVCSNLAVCLFTIFPRKRKLTWESLYEASLPERERRGESSQWRAAVRYQWTRSPLPRDKRGPHRRRRVLSTGRAVSAGKQALLHVASV